MIQLTHPKEPNVHLIYRHKYLMDNQYREYIKREIQRNYQDYTLEFDSSEIHIRYSSVVVRADTGEPLSPVWTVDIQHKFRNRVAVIGSFLVHSNKCS